MKIIDARALTPKGIDPGLWAERILRRREAADTVIIYTDDDRFEWLSRLHDEPWAPIEVQTTVDQFPFWSWVHERVEVYKEDGKRLGKAQKTTDIDHWSAAVMSSDTRKTAVKKWRKSVEDNAVERGKAQVLQSRLTTTKVTEVDLFQTDGSYEWVDPDDHQNHHKIIEEIRTHIVNGGWFAWDCETDQTGEDDYDAPNPYTATLVGVSVAIRPGHAWYFPTEHKTEPVWETESIVKLVEALYAQAKLSNARAVLWNCKYDYSVMANPKHGVSVKKIYEEWLPLTEDGMLLAAACNLPSAKLKDVSRDWLGVNTVDFKKLTNGQPFSHVPPEPAAIYAGQDADWPLRLWPLLKEKAADLQVEHIYRDTELPIIEYFMRMERHGVLVNQERLAEHTQEYEAKREFALNLFKQVAKNSGTVLDDDFNIGSPQQLRELLFSAMGIPVVDRTPTGVGSTSKTSMAKLFGTGYSHPILATLKAWRAADKMLVGFLYPIAQMIAPDGRIHCSFHQLAARTGRTSCSDPNMQQIPKAIRDIFIPDVGGQMAGIDYSQMELRVLAVEFNVEAMLETFNLPPFLPDGSKNYRADIHNTTMVRMGIKEATPERSRTIAKNCNFGKAFLAGVETLMATTGKTREVCQKLITDFDEAYPDYAQAVLDRIEADRDSGESRNWKGRYRDVWQGGEDVDRLIINTPVQGGAVDIIKDAMALLIPVLREAEQWGIHPFNMVHDELDFELEAGGNDARFAQFLAVVAQTMEMANPFIEQLPMPVDLEVGETWGDLRAPEVEEAA